MSEKNLFESASRLQMRFNTPDGMIPAGRLTIEDLWLIPLLPAGSRVNLDAIAKGLNNEIKESEHESFVVQNSTKDVELEQKFEIVKYIISVRLKEQDLVEKEAENRIQKEKIRSILAQKDDEELSKKSAEELRVLLAG